MNRISGSETVIIVAGGKGERMQTDVPKQFLEIHSIPVLMHTIQQFYNYNSEINIIVVLPQPQIDRWHELIKKHAFTVAHQVIAGGNVRFRSVVNGLSLAPHAGIIAVHDGVRPLVSTDTIRRCFDAAAAHGAVIPVADAIESIRQITPAGSMAVDRSLYKMVQTPQVFAAELLHKAYEQSFSPLFTDDASVVEALGERIHLVPGNIENIKITTPMDLQIAALLLQA